MVGSQQQNFTSTNTYRKRILQIVLGVIVLGALLWWTSTKVEWTMVLKAMSEAKYGIILATIPVIFLSHILRAWRWQTFIAPIQRTSLINTTSAVFAAYAANNMIPRSGELLRPYILSKRENIPVSTLIGTVIVERLYDVINLLIFVGIALILMSEKLTMIFSSVSSSTNSLEIHTVLYSLVAGCIFLLLLIVVLGWSHKWTYMLISMTIRPLSHTLADKVTGVVANIQTGISTLIQPQAFLKIIFQSLGIWLLYILPLYGAFFAFDFTNQLTFLDASILLLIMAIGMTVAPTPGGIGLVHILVASTMNILYQIPNEKAIAYVTVVHGVNYISVTLAGIISMIRENIRSFDTSA